jgi:hypothetical protein
MTAAIFGLLGVIVGGVLNGGVARWQALRTESDAVRAAARMMLHDAIRATVASEEIATYRRWPTSQYWPAPNARWAEHERLMAAALDFMDWAVIDQAWRAVANVDLSTAEVGEAVDDTACDRLADAHRALAKAMPVLTWLADKGTRPTVRQRLAARRRPIAKRLGRSS